MIRLLATGLTGAALLSAAVVLLVTASWRTALRVLLDLLTAAGLVRLAAARGWADVGAAVAVVAIRQTLAISLFANRAGGTGASGHPG